MEENNYETMDKMKEVETYKSMPLSYISASRTKLIALILVDKGEIHKKLRSQCRCVDQVEFPY